MTSITNSFDVPLDLDYAELAQDGQLSLGVPGEQRPIPTLAAPRGLTPEPCEFCGSDGAVGVCPKSLECPRCHAGPGKSCVRPSAHRAAELHSGRIALAEEMSRC